MNTNAFGGFNNQSTMSNPFARSATVNTSSFLSTGTNGNNNNLFNQPSPNLFGNQNNNNNNTGSGMGWGASTNNNSSNMGGTGGGGGTGFFNKQTMPNVNVGNQNSSSFIPNQSSFQINQNRSNSFMSTNNTMNSGNGTMGSMSGNSTFFNNNTNTGNTMNLGSNGFFGSNNNNNNNQNKNSSYLTRSSSNSSFTYGTNEKGTINIPQFFFKSTDGFAIASVTSDKNIKKSLEELRAEDYEFIKRGDIPDNLKQHITQTLETVSKGGSAPISDKSIRNFHHPNPPQNNPMFSGTGTMMGGTSNNLFTQNQSNNMMGNNSMNNNTSNNIFHKGNSFSNNTASMSNNMFNNSNNNNMNNNQSAFTQNQNQSQNQNPFQANNSVGGNPFHGRSLTQNSPFMPSNSNNNNVFQNNNSMSGNMNNSLTKPDSTFLQSTNNQGNAFANRNANVFNNQNQMQQSSAFPNQGNVFQQNNQANPFSNQMQQQNFPGNPNPHLFPNNAGAPGFPGHAAQGPQFFPGAQQPFGMAPGMPPGMPPGYPGYPNPYGQFGYPMNPYPGYYPPPGPYFDYGAYNNMQQNSLFSAFEEESRESRFTPTQTLDEAVIDIQNKLLYNRADSPKSTSLPYNPFKKQSTMHLETSNADFPRSSSSFWRGGRSPISRNNEPLTLIRKPKYAEEDAEIIMRRKNIIATKNRNRSHSPASTSRSQDLRASEQQRRPNEKNIYNESIKTKIEIRVGDESVRTIEVMIFKRETVRNLKSKVLEHLKAEGSLRIDANTPLDLIAQKSDLIVNNNRVADYNTLQDADIVDGSLHVLLVAEEYYRNNIHDENRYGSGADMEFRQNQSTPVRGYTTSSAVSKHMPKLTKQGYFISPSLEDLAKMSDRELAAVEEFTIWNECGKIEFEGRTDVRDVDLDEIVDIQNKYVEVYPDSKFPTAASKPMKGEKLNKPAFITLYKCVFLSAKPGMDVKKVLMEKAQKSGMEFIDYDQSNSVYKVRVKHF